MKNKHTYTGENTAMIAFPLGGIGAGMFCIQGSGAYGQFSLRNRPNLVDEPEIFSAIWVKSNEQTYARVLESQVPLHRRIKMRREEPNMGLGMNGANHGLPRFEDSVFTEKFPFAQIELLDTELPLKVDILAYSPFIPLNADDSSLPAAMISYQFTNPTDNEIEAVYSINSRNIMALGGAKKNIYPAKNGFIMNQQPEPKDITTEGDMYISLDDPDTVVNTDWFNGGWFDIRTQRWNDIRSGKNEGGSHPDNQSPGGSASVSFKLAPGESKTITAKFTWYVPYSDVVYPYFALKKGYQPWYVGKFKNAVEVMEYIDENGARLRSESESFANALERMELPDELTESIRANLSILKSPTILRQIDGKLWGWEGCAPEWGSCAGSCTHVWNYAQAISHLFPELERSLRETEYFVSQDETGHQQFRSILPIEGHTVHDYHAASDGQLGGIMKVYREWRICGDRQWLIKYWDKMEQSMKFSIDTWDKKREGVLKEPHHNTYDIEFWGAEIMCTSFYLGALYAMTLMGEELDKDVSLYRELYEKGKTYIDTNLFNGEYYYQQVEWETLSADLDIDGQDEKTAELLRKEGPKYQYGTGCISDGVLGAWLARCCGLGDILDVERTKSHLLSVYRYNLKKSLLRHENPQRPGYAMGDEGGLLLCTWPNGGKPSLPFVYSDEVWTGIEQQVASHLLFLGMTEEGLDIIRTCRSRFDGIVRNPFDEYECGHWYARAMASYSLIEAYSGVRYDKVEKKLYVSERNNKHYTVLLCTQDGYGLVKLENGKVELEIVSGEINVEEIVFE